MMDRAPTLTVPKTPRNSLAVSQVMTDAYVPMTRPSMLQQAAPSMPFICKDCRPTFPSFGQVTFAVQSSSEGSYVVADMMRNVRPDSFELRPSEIAITSNQVRFYRARDAVAAGQLADRYGASLVDLTWFAPKDEIARIDVLVADAAMTPATQGSP
ncbi:hypothetical protein [Yoonia sediminilitoris]|nr:hypothetical protein [Yoonia sediminilitoris]